MLLLVCVECALCAKVTVVQEQALSAAFRRWREVRHHLERCSGIKVEECPVCHGGECVHCTHSDGNLKLDVVDLSQNNYASRFEDVPGSLAVPVRLVVVPLAPQGCCWDSQRCCCVLLSTVCN